jgi:hypothetical protein
VVPNFPSRLVHDLGLAAWFGGTLANAVALNRAAGQASDPSSAARVANTGWDAWTPINAVAIGATIVGSVGQLLGNKERLATQSGVVSMSVQDRPHCDRFGHHGLQQGAWAQGVPGNQRSGVLRHRAKRRNSARRGTCSDPAEAAAMGGARDNRRHRGRQRLCR